MNDAEINTLRRNIRENKGWVCHALYCAIFGLLLAEKNYSFESIIETIITSGGDCDTTSCISGALIGFYFGYSKLISSPQTFANLNIIVNANWSAGDFPLDDFYHPKTLFPLLF